MLTPDYLDRVADEIVALYDQLNTSIIKDMARRIMRIGLSETTTWQSDIAQEAGAVFNDVIARIAEITGESEQILRETFMDAGAQALQFDDSVYRAAGLNPLPFKQSSEMLNVLLSNAQKTGGTLRNLTMTTATTSQQVFINTASLASLQVSSGAFSYTEAIRQAIKSMADQGAEVLYPTGHKDKLDVATRRAVMTGVNQTAAQMQIIRADEMECDLVETTAHLGARPTHAEWQGQVFSRSERRGYRPFSDTGYGSGDGLCGWNCRHNFYPFFEGLSSPSYSNDELEKLANATVEYEGKEIPHYEATQKQRAQERKIRAIKRELAGYDTAMKSTGDVNKKAELQSAFNAAAVSLKKAEAQYADFASQTGLGKQPERAQVEGFGRSVSQKAVWANKKNS